MSDKVFFTSLACLAALWFYLLGYLHAEHVAARDMRNTNYVQQWRNGGGR